MPVTTRTDQRRQCDALATHLLHQIAEYREGCDSLDAILRESRHGAGAREHGSCK